MGYNTTYFIKVPDRFSVDDLAFLVASENQGYGAEVYEDGNWRPGVDPPFVYVHGKWYDAIDDLKRVAIHLFAPMIVVGWGEDEGDVWVVYIMDDGTTTEKLKVKFLLPPNPKDLTTAS